MDSVEAIIILKTCLFSHHSSDSSDSPTFSNELTFFFFLVKKENQYGPVSVTDKVKGNIFWHLLLG